jgi:hypothetical protein
MFITSPIIAALSRRKSASAHTSWQLQYSGIRQKIHPAYLLGWPDVFKARGFLWVADTGTETLHNYLTPTQQSVWSASTTEIWSRDLPHTGQDSCWLHSTLLLVTSVLLCTSGPSPRPAHGISALPPLRQTDRQQAACHGVQNFKRETVRLLQQARRWIM